MNITDYILNDFNPLTTQSTVNDALGLCRIYPITHIPIVENGNYIGAISQTDLLTIENRDNSLDRYLDLFEQFNTVGSESALELLKKNEQLTMNELAFENITKVKCMTCQDKLTASSQQYAWPDTARLNCAIAPERRGLRY